MSSTEELIGRSDVNDVEGILAVVNTDVDEVTHAVADNADAIFTWDYTLARPALRKLYEKAKTGQWNATTDLPWDTEVDQEAIVVANNDQAIARGLSMDNDFFIGSPDAIPLWSPLVGLLVSMGVGVFFGAYPAVKASRLDPIESLRWE